MSYTLLSRCVLRCSCVAVIMLLPVICLALSVEDVRSLEDAMISEMRAVDDEEKALIEHFYHEGEKYMSRDNHEMAAEQFSYLLEIDPSHQKAKSRMSKIRAIKEKELAREIKDSSPDEIARKLLKAGKKKHRKGDYEGAIEDFQNALILDVDDDETIIEWLKRARRGKIVKEAEMDEEDNLRDIEAARAQKEAHEKRAMLEVERAYLPAEKPKKPEIEIEELISDEDLEDERARAKLLAELKAKSVPAVSLTDADIRDVIRQLMEITGVTIIIDEGALAKAVGSNVLRVTFTTVNAMPLLDLLEIALKATEMGYRVEPNYIWVSSKDKLSEEQLVTRTYRLKFGVRRRRKVELKDYSSDSSSSSASD